MGNGESLTNSHIRHLRPCYWLAVRRGREGCGIEVITLNPGNSRSGGTLPVFSFREEAEMFLGLGSLGDEWRARQTGTGELISLLFGLCGGVCRIVLDPLPESLSGTIDPLSVTRENFAGFLEDRDALTGRDPSPKRGQERG